MATSHREKDKEAGGKPAPKFGPAKQLTPEVAASLKAGFKNFTDEQQHEQQLSAVSDWEKLGRGKQAEKILEMVNAAVEIEKKRAKSTARSLLL